MQIIGVDLHTRQQTIAMLDTETGEVMEKTLKHEGETVREFYAALAGPVQVGIEATGSMHWFLELMEELGIDCRVGHPSEIRKAEARKQKHDRRDAALLLKLQVENRFPSIWMPSTEQRDLRTLLLHRHQWVRMRTRVQNTLQAMALSRRSAARQDPVEPSRPTRARVVAAAAACRLSAQRVASACTAVARGDRRSRQAGQEQARQRPGATVADDPSGSGAGHGVGHRSIFRRSDAIC